MNKDEPLHCSAYQCRQLAYHVVDGGRPLCNLHYAQWEKVRHDVGERSQYAADEDESEEV